MKGKRTMKRILAIVMAVAFTVTGITFTPEEAKAANVVTGSWQTIATNGWQYYAASSKGGTYTGGTSFSDGPVFNLTAGNWWDWDFQVKTPTQTITTAGEYTFSVTINETNRTGGNILQLFVNGTNVEETTKTASEVGTTTFSIDRTVPANAEVYMLLGQMGASQSTKTFSASVTPKTTQSQSQSQTESQTQSDWTDITQADTIISGSTNLGRILNCQSFNFKYKVDANDYVHVKNFSSSAQGGNAFFNMLETHSANTSYDVTAVIRSDTAFTFDWDGFAYYDPAQPVTISPVSVPANTDTTITYTITPQAAVNNSLGFKLNANDFPAGAEITFKSFSFTPSAGSWIPTSTANTSVGNDGTYIYNRFVGNTHYKGISSLNTLQLKQTAAAQTDPEWYYAEALRIPNNVALASCTDEHKYRMVYSFDADAAGGTAVVKIGGYGQDQIVTQAVTSGTNTFYVDFVSDSAVNISSNETELQFAGVAQDTVLDNFDIDIVELPREVTNIYGEVIGGNSLKVTWAAAAAGLTETYDVTLYEGSGTSGTSLGTHTVSNPATGYTYTGLTAGGTYTAKVVSKLGTYSSDPVTETFTVDPWIPVSTEVTAVGGSSSGIDIYNKWPGNTHYYYGTLSSLSGLQVKQTANPQTSEYYYAEAIRIANNVAYGSCVDEHLYRMTVTFDSSASGGTVVLANGYGNYDSHALSSGSNTYEVEFVSDSSKNTSAIKTELQFAGAPKDVVLDNFAYQVTELPRPAEHGSISGTSSGGTSLTVTWSPLAAGLTQLYKVTLYESDGTTVAKATQTTSAAGVHSMTFTGLTPGSYKAKVVGTLNGNDSTAEWGDVSVSEWIPTTSANTAIGSTGLFIYNAWPGNTEYKYNTLTSLSSAQLKQTANAQTDPTLYGAEAVVIPNNIAYASCTAQHKYRITATFTASTAGGTFALYQGGYNQTQTVAVDGTANQTVSIDFVSEDGKNTSALETKLCFAGVAKNTVLTNMSYNVVEVPREVDGVGIGSSIGLTNAGGKFVSTGWTDLAHATGTQYVVSLLNSSDQVLYTKTVAGTENNFKFQDGQTDDNGTTITINPNTTYKTQVVTKIGSATSDPVPSDQTTNTGVWMRAGSVGEYPAEDTLTVPTNARLSSYYGNVYYRYDHVSSLSDLILKKTSDPEDDNPAIYYFHRVGQKNSAIFGNTENGAKVRLTVSYNTSANAGGTIILQQKHGSDYTNTKHTVVPNMTGANKDSFYVDFDYYTADANEYADLVLGELTANTEISGIEFSFTVLEHWTAGISDGGWHDVGNYAYHIPSDQSGHYSTDTSSRFAMKVHWDDWTQEGGRWPAFYVGTNEKTVYPGSVYSYSINFNRTVPKTDASGDPPQNKVYLHVLYDNGTDLEIGNAVCDASGNASYSGEITIPDDATTARLYWVCQWPTEAERFSVDPNSGSAYTFQEVWRAVDDTQEVRDGKYKFIDKDGGALQYKPTQTSGTGSCDVRVAAGFTDPWVPYLKTNFAEGDYGVNFVEGNEYVATIKFDSNKAITTDGSKGIRFSDYNSGNPNSIALTGNSFEITFIYKDGYDITAGLGWLGDPNVVLSNFNVSVENGAPTMPLTNDGTNVIANWGGMSGVSGATKLVYVSFGEQKIIDVSGQSSYTFPSPFYPDNDTEVELYDRYTSASDHGTKLTRATALADFQIMDARVDGIAHANTNNIIKMVLKNVGTGKVIASDANQKFIYLTARQDDWRNYKYLCPDPQDLATDVVLDPNQEFDENSPFFERPCIDAWRVYEEGTYTIRCQVNETKIIREKNYANNSFTFRKEVSTQLADDTAVLGFQLNSNKSPGGPSEFSPSYRTVCRANKQVVVKEGDYAYDEDGNQLTVPTGTYTADANNFEYGFVYAYHDKAGLNSKNEDELMTFAGAKSNDYINTYKAKSQVDIDEWTTKDGSTYNKDNSFFFALTLKDLYYTTDQIETVYTFRSYLKFTTGGKEYIVYPKDVYSTSMYDIAEDLYRNKKMPSSEAHNYLYDNILNIVSMKHNAQSIGKAMMKKLNAHGQMPSSSSVNYRYANYVYQDMTFYALCSDPEGKTGGQYDAMKYLYADNIQRVKMNGEGKTYEISGEPASGEQVIQSAYTYNNYTYTHDREFRSIRLDKAGGYDSFLTALNASKENSDTNYESVNDWIYGEVPHATGYYQKVDYSWDSNLDKDYGTE